METLAFGGRRALSVEIEGKEKRIVPQKYKWINKLINKLINNNIV